MRKSPLNTQWQQKWLDLENRSDEIQRMADDVAGWSKRFFNHNKDRRTIILAGKVGIGKTHTAERMYRWSKLIAITAWDSGNWPSPPRIEWTEWAKVAFLGPVEFRAWLDGLTDTSLLFLEDIGAEVDRFKSGEPTERLREVLNEFKNRWMFITTNIMPEEWKPKWDERVADRLMRNSVTCVFRNLQSFTTE